MNRKKFIQLSSTLVAGSILNAHDLTASGIFGKQELVILHTNDFHSRFEPFPSSHKLWGDKGGISRLKTLIDQYRSQYKHILLLDSGDVWQGTAYFNVFKGHPELEWMKNVNYQATTIGNHDFDLGIDHLCELRKKYQTPTVLCNYQINHPGFKEIIQPYKIIETGKFKVGITGVAIDFEDLLPQKSYEGIIYQDPVEPLQMIVNELRNKHKCDLVIVLSHLGYQYDSDKIDDLKLAQKTEGIDAILGGHTHTFLEKPILVKNKMGKNTVVNQAGWAGLRLGKLHFQI
jgi:5'-nucleotidase